MAVNGNKQLQRRRRIACREQKWLCYYCNQLMIEFTERPRKGVKHPDNAATLEHLDDRFSPDRGTRAGDIRRVAACRKCNQERGTIRQAEQGIDELRKRAKH